MEKKIKILISKSINKEIFNFLKLSNGTKRSIVSFKKNKIIFLIAQLDNKIIGCIPLEPRRIKIRNKFIKTYYITNAFIIKKFQNLGIGTTLIDYYNKKIKIPLFAFRLMKRDQASHWYKKNNFKKIYDIYSYKLNIKKLKKIVSSKKFEKKKFKTIKLNNINKSKVLKIINKRKSNLVNNSNIYYHNYYENYLRKISIFYIFSNNNYIFCTIGLTSLGNKVKRYEIFDNNLNYNDLLIFINYFISSNFYQKKYLINYKVSNNVDLSKIEKIFDKDKYKSNLITNLKNKNLKSFKFNLIEYV